MSGVPGVRVNLMNLSAQTSSVNGSASVLTDRGGTSFTAHLDAENNGGTTPTLDVVIQHRPHDTAVWQTLVTFTPQTTETGDNGVENVHLTEDTNVFPHLRAVATLGGTTPDYDILVDFYHN